MIRRLFASRRALLAELNRRQVQYLTLVFDLGREQTLNNDLIAEVQDLTAQLDQAHTNADRKPMHLFGPGRIRPGAPDLEWSVWVTGMDTHLPQSDQETALAAAADINNTEAAIYDGQPYTPVVHAVVLHQGYAWRRPSPEVKPGPQPRPEPVLDEAAAMAYYDALLGGESTSRVERLYSEWQDLAERRIARSDSPRGGAA